MLNFIFKLINILSIIVKTVTTAVTVVAGVVTAANHVGQAAIGMSNYWEDLLGTIG